MTSNQLWPLTAWNENPSANLGSSVPQIHRVQLRLRHRFPGRCEEFAPLAVEKCWVPQTSSFHIWIWREWMKSFWVEGSKSTQTNWRLERTKVSAELAENGLGNCTWPADYVEKVIESSECSSWVLHSLLLHQLHNRWTLDWVASRAQQQGTTFFRGTLRSTFQMCF